MSAAKYTPGPLKVFANDTDNATKFLVVAPGVDGRWVAIGTASRCGDATIFAASPELLEAGEELEVAVSMVFGPEREDTIRTAAAKMRAAIAKAEGRT